MRTIKRYQFSILIVFIIASTLYGIHMFRYSFIELNNNVVIRYDRITNTQCISTTPSRSNTQLNQLSKYPTNLKGCKFNKK